MQTNFSLAQLADPATAASEKILRACVHCGFCTATCPTFLLLGDELDSPRGRIYLIKDMLEKNKPADGVVVKHIDRCLSCLSCMTACPSGVNYQHLADHARSYIEATYKRPLADRLLRALLASVLPNPKRFRAALAGARLAQPLQALFASFGRTGRRLDAMIRLARESGGKSLPPARPRAIEFPQRPNARVALLRGCVQQVLRPGINEAATRLLSRLAVETVFPQGEGCCGALLHHLGKAEAAAQQARANIDAWCAEAARNGLDAIVITASGCGSMIKDYGFLMRNDKAYAQKAALVSTLAKDVTEFIAGLKFPPPVRAPRTVVAYHSACSLQHGQKIDALPRELLRKAGFEVRDFPEGDICCGSAGTYNILEPELAGQLRARKIMNILQTSPDVIATGNIGCMTQIASATSIPVLHTVELLELAYGGPQPAGLGSSPRR